MIRGYQPPRLSEPEGGLTFQWGAALGAGLLAGVVLLLIPRGSPWSALTFFSRVIMGRTLPSAETALPVAWAIHLAISVVYGLIISRAASALPGERAILAGGLVGFILYLVNFAVVSFFWSWLRGNEIAVLFTHVVFGLITGGAYRGLLRRRARAELGFEI